MSCEHFEDLILDEIDGRLSAESAAGLAEHLRGCEECRGFRAAQQALDSELAGIRVPRTDSAFAARVLERVDGLPRHFVLRLSAVFELAALGSVAAAGGIAVQVLFPMTLIGLPWITAAAILGVGAVFTLAMPPAPSA